MADNVVVKFTADVQDIKARLAELERSLSKAQGTAETTGKKINDSFKNGSDGVKNIGKEVEGTSNAIGGKLNEAVTSIGTSIIAAFAVERVIEFGKESVKAFQEAELNAIRLKTAVQVNGGLSGDFEKLIKQSEELQTKSIFSDDEIQRAQALASQIGLTSDKVEEIIPVIADFASATGKDLNEALNNVIQGMNGNGRELRKYIGTLDDSLSSTEKLDEITRRLNQKFEGQAEIIGNTAAGAMKKYENAVDDLQESLGEKLSPVIENIKIGMLSFVNDLISFPGLIKSVFSGGAEESTLEFFNRQYEFAKRSTKALDDAALSQENYRIGNEILRRTRERNATNPESDEYEAISRGLTQALAIQKAYTEEIKRRADAVKKAKEGEEDLTKISTDELKKRLKVLSLSTLRTDQDQADKIREILAKRAENEKKIFEEIVKNREDASKKLTELAKQSEASAELTTAKDPIDELEKERKQRIKNVESIFDASKLEAADFANLAAAKENITKEFDARIKAERDKQAEARKTSEQKNLEDIFKTESEFIDSTAEKRKQKLIEEFNAKGVFTKEAQEKLNGELDKIDEDSAQRRLSIAKQLGLDISKGEKELTDAQKKEIDKRVKDFTEEQQKKLAELDKLFTKIGAFGSVVSQSLELFNTLGQAQIESIQEQADAALSAYDDELTALEDKNRQKIISDREYEKQRNDLLAKRKKTEEDFAKQQKDIQRQQAEANKLNSIFNIIINTAQGVTAQLAVGNIILASLVGALGALQLATVAATPIPKFKDGTPFVDSNTAPQGRDTIPAYLDRGERVITREDNKKNWKIYEAIRKNNFEQFVAYNYTAPALREHKRRIEEQKGKDFASNIATSLMATGGLTANDMRRIAEKGTEIRNSDELAIKFADRISERLPFITKGW